MGFASGALVSVGEDAAHIADHIEGRMESGEKRTLPHRAVPGSRFRCTLLAKGHLG